MLRRREIEVKKGLFLNLPVFESGQLCLESLVSEYGTPSKAAKQPSGLSKVREWFSVWVAAALDMIALFQR